MKAIEVLKLSFVQVFFSVVLLSFLSQAACKRGLYKADFKNVGGIVVAKEICEGTDNDYWLLDLSYYRDTPKYGDTILINGIKHVNVVKTKELHPTLKQIGMKVSIDFKVITQERILTTGCTVSNPSTYSLKELYIINQGEIR